jgi:signal transduction histidine kinase
VIKLRIRWLLLGVSALLFVLPALFLAGLRSYTGYLVRRTEEQLLGQGVLIAEAFRDAWRRENGNEKPLPPEERAPTAAARYAPITLLAEHIRELSPSEPALLPAMTPEQRESTAFRAGRALEPLLRRAQVYNLSAVRVLDPAGCVVATTRSDSERCLAALPEVERALGGHYAAALRARVSDEPPPPLESLSRRGDKRLFLALPVVERGALIGVVRLSRTAESGLEWLWKNRLPLLGIVTLMLGAALFSSFVCAALIARPLERMALAARRVSTSGAPWRADVVGRAPLELAELGAALRAMTERLASRAEYIAEFTANVGHELKTPLTSIRGAAELLREQWQSMDLTRRDRFLGNIQADAERTETLVRGLLHLARIENQAGSPEPAVIRLAEFERALALRYPEHVEITLEPADASITMAAEHLHSAVGNLIDNALRHRREKPVAVRLAERAGRLVVEVRDDGPGVSPANLPKVFDRFFTTERDQGGTGLGLAIVRAIAEARGGSATCESSPEGTLFRLVL